MATPRTIKPTAPPPRRASTPTPTRRRTATRAPKPAPPRPPSRVRRFVLRAALHLMIAAVLVGGVGYAAVASRAYVERVDAAAAPSQLTVVLEDKPVWMSDFLARQIAASVPRTPASPYDAGLVRAVYDRLAVNPWVQQVRQVRRAYGERPGDTLMIDCAFRTPVALVQWGDYYWLVDNDGFKLPSAFNAADVPQVARGRDGHVALRVVTGVRRPPPSDGHRWAGADLAVALDMAKLLAGKPWLDEVTGIDVANVGGRVGRGDPQVVLDTSHGTQVWWGRPVLADGDYLVEVPVARKLATLAAVLKQYGRIDAGRAWLDVRFDIGLVPADEPTTRPATP